MLQETLLCHSKFCSSCSSRKKHTSSCLQCLILVVKRAAIYRDRLLDDQYSYTHLILNCGPNTMPDTNPKPHPYHNPKQRPIQI